MSPSNAFVFIFISEIEPAKWLGHFHHSLLTWHFSLALCIVLYRMVLIKFSSSYSLVALSQSLQSPGRWGVINYRKGE